MNHGIIFTGMDSEDSLGRPMGAYRLRTYLKKENYNLEIIDYFSKFSYREIKKLCYKFITNETLFVGVSTTFFCETKKINFLFKILKRDFPHIKRLIGGTETTLEGLDTSLVDRFLWGYAEGAVKHYLDFLSGKTKEDLNWVSYKGSLAIDAEQAYEVESKDLSVEWYPDDYMTINAMPIEISRGCIFRCRFCQYPLLGKKKNDYIRNENNLADEFKRNYEQWGINNYSFSDDTFNDNIHKLEYVANSIEKSGVKITYSCYLRADLLHSFPEMIPLLMQTGLVGAHFGLESLNETAKKAIGKGMNNEHQFEAIKNLKKLGPVYTFTGMIIGLPGESIESIHKSQEWLLSQGGEIINDWQWWPLGIRKNHMTRKSEFDINYAKWGYTIDEDVSHDYSRWKNEYMDIETARELAHQLNMQTMKHKQIKPIYGSVGLWNAAEMVGLGIPIEDLINNNVDLKVLNRAYSNAKKGIEFYKQEKLKGLEKDNIFIILLDRLTRNFLWSTRFL